MTRLGWVVLFTTVLAIIAGIVLGWTEFATLGISAAAALILAAVQTLGRSPYLVKIDLPTHRTRVGQKLNAEIAVQNTGKRLVLPAYLRVPVGANAAQFNVPLLRPGQLHDELIVIPTERRGVITMGPATTMRGDVLGLIRREMAWTDPVELFVHPEIVRLDGSGSGLMRDLEGQSLQIISDSDISFHALREYIPGDDRRHIHWKTSARIGDLMVRQFDDTRRTRTALLLTTHQDEFASDSEFELAASVFASLGAQTLREERDLVALAGNERMRIGVPVQFLDGCARFELGPNYRRAPQLSPWLAQEVPDASVAFFVVGSQRSAAELRAQVAPVDKSIMIFVIQCERGTASEVRPLGDATLIRVGSLTELPRLMQRAVR